MILTEKEIKKFMSDNILIKNGIEENVSSTSYDLTSGKYILKIKENKKAISLLDVENLENMYEQIDISNGYKFRPGDCILVALEEEFNMPDNVCGSIRGRTSFNRLGIFTTIQHINPGFKGKLNITVVNNSPNTFLLMPKTKLVQVVFEKLSESVSDNYLYGNVSKISYQNEDGLKGSKAYKDCIGKVVRHYKGNYYYIENVCMNSETEEYEIIYKTLYNSEISNIWARPAKMFFEEIDPKMKGNVTGQNHRFEIVDDLIIDYTKKSN